MREFPIVKKLGGRRATLEAIRRKVPITGTRAIGMWVTRGVIPGPAIIALMEVAEHRRISYKAKDFKLRETPARHGAAVR